MTVEAPAQGEASGCKRCIEITRALRDRHNQANPIVRGMLHDIRDEHAAEHARAFNEFARVVGA